jgi:anti-anti-sigma regulatory factor
MEKFPKIEINPAGTLVTARYCGHITADDLQADLVDAALASKARPGFTLLVDLSTLDSMDQTCATALGQIMDRIDSYGVTTIIRIIPDPAKDLGFNILSLFHYPPDTTTITCNSLGEASSLLE